MEERKSNAIGDAIMKILLYQVGRNLNRCYRTAEAFGVEEIQLLECNATMRGNLFQATDRVSMSNIKSWPDPAGLLALETFYLNPIWSVDWSLVSTIVVGGETYGLPGRLQAEQKAYIPMVGKISGLTVEAALAIALYEWRRCEHI